MNTVRIENVIYELINCDVVEVSLIDGTVLGQIFINDGDWDLIESGANPIEDGWEDGNGNILSLDGWGI